MDNMFSVHIIVFEEIATEIILLLSPRRFQKVPISLSTLTHLAGVFKFVHFRERFQKVLFSVAECAWKANPDKKKVAFSNLSSSVWT